MFKKIRHLSARASTALVVAIAVGLQVDAKPTTAALMQYVHWRAAQITAELDQLVLPMLRHDRYVQITVPHSRHAYPPG